jgi:hypothetical protein
MVLEGPIPPKAERSARLALKSMESGEKASNFLTKSGFTAKNAKNAKSLINLPGVLGALGGKKT